MSATQNKGLNIVPNSDAESNGAAAAAPVSPTGSTGSSNNGGNASPSLGQKVANMTNEERSASIRKTVEYYFSKENLQNDAYLTSQMDAQMTVGISVIMKFSKMKVLVGGDETLFRDSLAGSTVCTINGDRIKANVKAGGRSTIILREVPADTPESEIREIFAFEGCKHIASLRSDIENTWFVIMESETDAKDTLLDLKLKGRKFRGESVKARLKTEAVVRSYYTQPNLSPQYGVPNGMPYQQFGAPMQQGGFPGQMGGGMPYGMPLMGGPGIPMPEGFPMGMIGGQGLPLGADGNIIPGPGVGQGGLTIGTHGSDDAGARGAQKGNDKKDNRSNRANAQSGATDSRAQQNFNNRGGADSNNGRNTKSSNNPRGNSNGDRQEGTSGGARQPQTSRAQGKGKGKPDARGPGGAIVQPVEVNLTNFPPLHVDETPVPTPGYDGDYKKYNADEIINIVKNIREAPLPLSSQDGKPLNPQEHSHSMTSTPNMDLLKRQRSFSIEETREQLQQGRPVHKEAVAAGPVDYSAMIYGDAFGRSASIDDSITPADITGTSVNSMSAAHTSGGSAHGAAGHAGQGSSNSAAAGGKAKKGNSQPPSASSWAALVKSSASPSGTQTDTLASAAGSSQSKPSSNQAQTSNGKDSNKQGGNGRVEKQSNGSSTGQNLGGRNNNNISNGGSKDNKDKDGQKGNSKGGEKNQGRAKNGRKKESNDDNSSQASEANVTTESQTPSGWGAKPSFANILKSAAADESPSSTKVGKSTSSTGTQSEFSEMTITARGGSASVGAAKKATPSSGTGAATDSPAGDKAGSVIDTTEDGTWARKTLS